MSKRYSLICLVALGIGFVPTVPCTTSQAATAADGFLEITTQPLWDGPAPGAKGQGEGDVPTLSLFRPQNHHGNGTAVIVAPGGAYVGLAGNLEGRQVADWFAAHGVTAFLLKYRLAPNYRHPIQLWDAQRAIRLVRSRATAYGIAPDRIGMIGFSAGGHLTAMAATHFDSGNPDAGDPIDHAGSRPDFIMLGYPVISFENLTPGLRNVLDPFVGPNPNQSLLDDLSVERHVTAQTPRAFIYATTDDELVPVEQSLVFYRALHAAGVPVEMHLFAHGAHGSGLGSGDPALDFWPAALENWLRAQELFTVAPAALAAVHTPGPLSVDATMGELLTDPAAHAVLQEELPQFASSPQLEQARDLTLRSLQRYVPKLLTDAKLHEVDAKLRAATAQRR
jgi:acetyl esterase/lipase